MASTEKNPRKPSRRTPTSKTSLQRPSTGVSSQGNAIRTTAPSRKGTGDIMRSFNAKTGVINGLLFPEMTKQPRATSPDDSFRLSDLMADMKRRKAEAFRQIAQSAQNTLHGTSPSSYESAATLRDTVAAPTLDDFPRSPIADVTETAAPLSKQKSTPEESCISLANADNLPAIFGTSTTIETSSTETRRNAHKAKPASSRHMTRRIETPMARDSSLPELSSDLSAPDLALTGAAPVSLHPTCSPTISSRDLSDPKISLESRHNNQASTENQRLECSILSPTFSLYDKAREAINSLIYQMKLVGHTSQEIHTFQNAAFTGAAMISFYASIGSTMWKYLQKEIALQPYEYIANHPECPSHARRPILDSLAQLADVEPFIPKLTAEDIDQTDAKHDPLVKQLAVETQTALDKLFFGDYDVDNTHDRLLTDARTLLNARIHFSWKVELVGMARILWPMEKFETRSAALGEFIASHDMHLRKLKSCTASDS